MARLPQVRELRKHWQLVYQYYWDSGGPVVGAGVEKVYRREDRYVVVDCDGQRHGPFGSLISAIDNCELSNVTEATTQSRIYIFAYIFTPIPPHSSHDYGHRVVYPELTQCAVRVDMPTPFFPE